MAVRHTKVRYHVATLLLSTVFWKEMAANFPKRPGSVSFLLLLASPHLLPPNPPKKYADGPDATHSVAVPGSYFTRKAVVK